MANYCSRFIQSYATLTQPPRELTQEDRTWGWMARHDQAQLKGALANVPVTAYNDPDKDTEIRVDTSPIDLGAIPAQTYPDSGNQQVVVAYASRSLSDMEQRYSQNEREALAVVWVCEYFHLYAYGKSITVHRDHNALVTIYGKPKSKPSTRIERWALRLQPYQVTVAYRKGEENPANYISRHPARQTPTTSRQERVTEKFVDYIACTSTPKALRLQDIESATE